MRAVVPCLLTVLAAGHLAAAVAGVPEAPRPGPRPAAWFAWGNDAFGGETGDNTDDYRTNAFTLGIQHHGWVGSIDHAMLTDRTGAGLRSDQLSLALGHEWDGSYGLGDTWWLSGGLGLRSTSDWGGQWLQDRWHEMNGFVRYSLAEDATRTEGTAWTHGEWLLTGSRLGLPDLPWLRPGQLGLDLRAGGMVTSGGQTLGSVGASVALLGTDGHVLLGVTQELRGGTPPNGTAALTAHHEEGTWLSYGVGAGGWFFQGGWGLDHTATWGAVGWQWGRTPLRGAGQQATLEGVFALYQGYALGMQYRWQPDWLATATARHASTFVDYRFGRYPGPGWDGTDLVVMRQGIAGVDWEALRLGDDDVSLAPFLQAGGGLRQERVQSAGDGSRFPDQAALRAVAQGTIGLRLMFAVGAEHLPAYGLSLVYDAWQPLGSATAVNDATGDRGTYLQGGGALGVRFNARIAW